MRQAIKRFFYIGILIGICLLIGVIIFVAQLEATLPDVNTLKDVHLQVPLRVFTRDNKLLAKFGKVKRIPINLDEVPRSVINATLATEDQRFFSHSGVDIFGLARAAVVLLTTGEKQQGGSTITMQVARNFFLTRHKTYWRKFKEILLALKIDRTFSKKKILELYFDKIFYGNRSYGIAAAAQTYYGKKLNELTLPQIAMLAGIPKAPSALNPLANPNAALERRNHALKRLLDLGYIDKENYESSIATPLTAKYHGLKIIVKAPYAAEMIRQSMIKQFGNSAYEAGYDVYTTIDSQKQIAANKALASALLNYDHRHGYRGPEKTLSANDLNYTEMWLKTLRTISNVSDLQPAIVLDVQDVDAKVLLKTGETVTIPWVNMSWARKQIMRNEQEYLGRKPQEPSDILSTGDLIRIKQLPDQSWALEQIPEAESAIVALNPKDGAIIALSGGFNYYNNKFNHATQAERQPGSSFKPFIYSAALEKGFTLATVINDAPIVMQDSGENPLWRPENDTQKFYGPTRLRTAMIKSRNLVSIRILQSIGIQYAIDYVSRFGFDRYKLPKSLSLALGTASVSPLTMARAYAVFANGGYRITPYFIDHISYKNQTIYQTKPLIASEPTQAIDDANTNTLTFAPRVITSQNNYLMNSALKDVIKKGTGRAARILNRSDLAGKTGTTNDKHDAWFCGFNANLVAITWMGFDQPRPLYEYAAQSALPMWIKFMGNALQNQPEATLPQPPGIVSARIDKKTGLLAPTDDQNTMFEFFRENSAPKQMDNHAATPTQSHINTHMEESNINELY